MGDIMKTKRPKARPKRGDMDIRLSMLQVVTGKEPEALPKQGIFDATGVNWTIGNKHFNKLLSCGAFEYLESGLVAITPRGIELMKYLNNSKTILGAKDFGVL